MTISRKSKWFLNLFFINDTGYLLTKGFTNCRLLMYFQIALKNRKSLRSIEENSKRRVKIPKVLKEEKLLRKLKEIYHFAASLLNSGQETGQLLTGGRFCYMSFFVFHWQFS